MEDIKRLELPKQPEVVLKIKEKIEDNYKVKEELGKGKFGVVKKVEDKRNGKIYAAKWIKMSSASRDETMGEIEAMNQLHSKRLICLHDAYETKTNLIVVLELVSGGELFEKIANEDNLTELEASRYIKQVLQGVYHMHNKKIVHLDLKPENILCVPKPGGKDDIKLIDFGMAREATPGLKVTCGTPEFVAPEVLKCEEVTLYSDMWSVGVIAYVLLSGLSPFAGESDVETMQNVIDGDFDFEDEDGSFDVVSECGKEFIEDLLFLIPSDRMSVKECLQHDWVTDEEELSKQKLCTNNLKKFIARRRWQRTGAALRALSRMSIGSINVDKVQTEEKDKIESKQGTKYDKSTKYSEKTNANSAESKTERYRRNETSLKEDISARQTKNIPRENEEEAKTRNPVKNESPINAREESSRQNKVCSKDEGNSRNKESASWKDRHLGLRKDNQEKLIKDTSTDKKFSRSVAGSSDTTSETKQTHFSRNDKSKLGEVSTQDSKKSVNGDVNQNLINGNELEPSPRFPRTHIPSWAVKMSASKIVLTESDLRKESPEKYYTWGDEIGRGEFAVVKSCAAKGKGLPYAAKFIKYEDDNDKMMGVREYDIIKELDHVNINKLIEGYLVRKYIVLIFEFVEGRDILAYTAAKLSVTEDTLANLTRQAMDALQYIHSKSIVHLDIRPDNLMVSKNGELKIIDFGCARKLSQGVGAIGEVAGNSEFRAPELFNFEPASISADLWSYGIILYGMVSGKLPYTGDSDEEILEKMNKSKVDFNDALWKKHSENLKKFIANLVVKNPDRRLTAAQALEHDWLSVTESKRRKQISIDNKKLRDLKAMLDDLDDEPISASCVMRTFEEEPYESPESESEEEEDD